MLASSTPNLTLMLVSLFPVMLFMPAARISSALDALLALTRTPLAFVNGFLENVPRLVLIPTDPDLWRMSSATLVANLFIYPID